jgi:hypothetical protein
MDMTYYDHLANKWLAKEQRCIKQTAITILALQPEYKEKKETAWLGTRRDPRKG